MPVTSFNILFFEIFRYITVFYWSKTAVTAFMAFPGVRKGFFQYLEEVTGVWLEFFRPAVRTDSFFHIVSAT